MYPLKPVTSMIDPGGSPEACLVSQEASWMYDCLGNGVEVMVDDQTSTTVITVVKSGAASLMRLKL